MNQLLKPYFSEICYSFFYDILIYSPSFHLQHLNQALAFLSEEQLFVKLSKC